MTELKATNDFADQPNLSFFIENLPNELSEKIFNYLEPEDRCEYLRAALGQFLDIFKPRGIYFYDLFEEGSEQKTGQQDRDQLDDTEDQQLANKLKQ